MRKLRKQNRTEFVSIRENNTAREIEVSNKLRSQAIIDFDNSSSKTSFDEQSHSGLILKIMDLDLVTDERRLLLAIIKEQSLGKTNSFVEISRKKLSSIYKMNKSNIANATLSLYEKGLILFQLQAKNKPRLFKVSL